MSRAVKSQPAASAGRPVEWGAWEWRNQFATPAGYAQALAVGRPPPKGLKRACLNNVYAVTFYEVDSQWGKIDHLMIQRHDGSTSVSWVDKQRIKDELIGTDRTAIEVYPARSHLVDDANIYHLWVLPEGMSLPFGL